MRVHLRLAVLLATILLAVASASAGEYRVTYVGGTSETIDVYGSTFVASPAYATVPPSLTPTYYVNAPGVYRAQEAYAGGQITLHFKWHATYSGEQPPALAILRLNSDAACTGVDGSFNGYCDNGFNSSVTTFVQSNGIGNYRYYLSTGSRFEVLENPPAEFDRTVSPVGYAIGFEPSASFSVRGDVFPVSIEFSSNGVPSFSDQSKLYSLVGAQTKAKIVIGRSTDSQALPGGLSNYSWSVSGRVFDRWELSQSRKQASTPVYGLSMTEQAAAEPKWRWLSAGAGEDSNVSVGAEVQLTTTYGDVLTLNPIRTLELVRPNLVLNDTIFDQDFVFEYVPGTDPTKGRLIAQNEDEETDVNFFAKVAMPAATPFVSNRGKWMFVQIAKPKRKLDNGSLLNIEANDWYIDSDIPYGRLHLENSGTFEPSAVDEGAVGDNPRQGLGVSSSYLIDDKFEMFIMYSPDESTTDFAAAVPLFRYEWSFKAAGSRGSTLDFWPNPSSFTITKISALGDQLEHPSWIESTDIFVPAQKP